MVVKKDAYLPKHQHVTSVPNIVVMMVVKSLKSRRYLEEVFSWQWNYYFLTDAGVKYLCKYLGLPEDVVPSTFKKTKVARGNEEEDDKKEGLEDDEDGKKKGEDDDEKPTELRA
mmetsp:Transcript_121646/g.171208  ORF Transcript_121646/g.171208 Transcript_121646/m.171208 type:complete len:114 (-) Transcript_121646:36-377(-)